MEYTNAFVASDLYIAGTDEDGSSIVGESFYVVAENDRGDRVRHQAAFNTITNVRWSNECDCMTLDRHDDAAERAERLLVKVLASGIKINDELWEVMRPCYGSDAYVEYGQADDVMWEKANG